MRASIPAMQIEVRRQGKINTLDVAGNITIGKGDVILRERVRELLDAGEKLLLLNLDQVGYLDSAGVGELVAIHKRVSDHQGVVKLVMPIMGRTHKIFTMSALHRVFEIYGDEDEALSRFPQD